MSRVKSTTGGNMSHSKSSTRGEINTKLFYAVATTITLFFLSSFLPRLQTFYFHEEQDVHDSHFLPRDPWSLQNTTQKEMQDQRSNIQRGEVRIHVHSDHDRILPYLHCGVQASDTDTSIAGNVQKSEILLLHGTAFTKDDWEASGILQSLCRLGNTDPHDPTFRVVAVVALDLDVSADGILLHEAVYALQEEGILRGDPLVIVTPSASGKSVLSLARQDSKTDTSKSLYFGNMQEDSLLRKMVQIWIPIASYDVLHEPDESLQSFITAEIPVYAIHGDQDTRGKIVSQRLVQYAGAQSIELKGRHPCYLDSPHAFVRTVLNILAEH